MSNKERKVADRNYFPEDGSVWDIIALIAIALGGAIVAFIETVKVVMNGQ
jgi:hypothetical protein